MARKKQMGRPSKRVLAPKIDAPVEEVAHFVLNAGRPGHQVREEGFYCKDCKRQVGYPEILYDDGRCESCHQSAT